LEREAQAPKPGSPEALARACVKCAALRARLLDHEAALADLRRSLELVPGHLEALELARDCAKSAAAQSPEVLAGPASAWSGCGTAFQALRARLRGLGYMSARHRWSWPPRLPPVRDLASDPAAWSGKDSEGGVMEEALGLKPGSLITKPGPQQGLPPAARLDPSLLPYVLPQGAHAHDLVDLVRLFMLHRSLPLGRVAGLLGSEVCALLLESSALTCYRSATARLLEPKEAAALVPDSARGAAEMPEAFANILLWPLDDELLVAFDFEQAFQIEGHFEPVPYLGQDVHALIAAAPRSPVASALDICCGSGAQGLVALHHYARRATFLDPNPRALRFARFSAHLNGLEDRSSFVEGSLNEAELPKALEGQAFEAVLVSPGTLPNPGTAVACGGPCFARGGADGQAVLAAALGRGVRRLLAPGGRLLAATLVPDAGGLAARLTKWADAAGEGPAELRAVVLRGEPLRAEDYAHLAAVGCPPFSAAALLGGLQREGLRSVSQAVVLLQARPKGEKVPPHAPRVETLPEHPGLWSDEPYLRRELQTALDRLTSAAPLDDRAEGGPSPAAEALYSLDWGDGRKDGGQASSAVPLARPGACGGWSALQGKPAKNQYSITLDRTGGTNLGAQVNPGDGKTLVIESVLGGLFKDWNAANPRLQVVKGDRIVEVNGIRGSSAQILEECRQSKLLQVTLCREAEERRSALLAPSPAQRGEFLPDASRWKDVALHRLLGWSPPALCDWRWHKTAVPLGAKQRSSPPSGFRMAIVELRHCRMSSEVREALRSLGCTDRFAFDGEPRALRPLETGAAPAETEAVLGAYDVLLLPLDTGGGRSRPLHELPLEALLLVEVVARFVYSSKKPVRLLPLTCGCSGPSYAGAADDGYGLPAAVPLRGIFRCSRIENLQLPILHLDSDALCEAGRGRELAAQIDCELELSTPEVGFYKADVAEQNYAILHTHREVAYRGGARFLPKLDLCARNPIFPGASIGPLPGSSGQGVALITGGTGGLGILTAEALVELGVTCVVLSSRSGRISRGYQGLDQRLEALRISGARVELEACDQTDERQVQQLLEKIRRDFGPLRWVMNAAGIVLPQDPSLMQGVFEPKCLGAWYMHKHTATDDIRTFMMYSSMSAGAGANDLSNYAAANTYIDELARLRQSQGLAAVSIMFPEVEEAGMAADMIGKGGAANIPAGNVKQTIKQVVCGTGPMAPSVAIVPQGYLLPRTPTMDSALDPLKARMDKELFDRLRAEQKSRK